MEFEDDFEFESLKEVDRGASGTAVIEELNRHVVALRSLGSDTQRLAEQAARRGADFEKLYKEHRAGAGVEVVPNGSVGEMDAQFVREDGSLRLGSWEEMIPTPDGSTMIPEKREGLLTSASVTPEMERLRRSYGAYALAFHRAKLLNRNNPWSDRVLQSAWRKFVGAARSMPGRTGQALRGMLANMDALKRAINGSSANGAELISNPTTQNILRPFDLARTLPGQIMMRDPGNSTFKDPVVTGRVLGRQRGSTSDDPAKYRHATITTSDQSRTIKNLVMMLLADPMVMKDIEAVLGDPAGFLMNLIEQGYADTLELAFLHGDTAATHQDTIGTWTMGGYYSSGDLGGTDSPLALWLGFRAIAFDDSNTVSGGGTWGIDDHTAAMALLGNHAKGRVVQVMGLATLFSQIIGNSNFLTVQNYGQKATLLTGEVGSIAGVPVVISEFMPSQFASTGLYTGSGSTGQIVYANLDAFCYYDLPAGAEDFDAIYPEKGARYIGAVRRGLLVKQAVSSQKPCAVINNL